MNRTPPARTLPARTPHARILHAEWTKLRTAGGTGWLLLAVVTLTAAVGAAVAGSVTCRTAGGCGQDPAKLSLTGIYLGQAVVAILAVLSIGGECGTGMIRLTFTAMPRRGSVLAAKAAVVTAPVLAAGTVAAIGSVLAGQVILPGHGLAGPPLSLGNGADLRAALGSALYLTLIGLLALGVAAAVRDSAAAIGIVLGLLFLFPLLLTTVSAGPWRRHLEQLAPMPAGLDIQATVNIRALPLTPWQGLGVLAAWAAGALLLGALALRLRDA
jgi:ABC-2 type transport system permease protein